MILDLAKEEKIQNNILEKITEVMEEIENKIRKKYNLPLNNNSENSKKELSKKEVVKKELSKKEA